MESRYIFVTGGVLSSLGKGVAIASIGKIIQSMGYSVTIKKMDPYLNVDPGTLNPYEHGEVFVTEDGAETDLDLGYYERFTGIKTNRSNNITAGQIYESIIRKERDGSYGGKTVQVVPHVINEIKEFIKSGSENKDFILCEIGGTVGDIEVLPFLEAVRQIKNEFGHSRVANFHLTLVPYVEAAGELKTKPTQNSVKELLSVGIQADFVLCRTQKPISDAMKDKISLFCNIRPSRIIEAIDTDFIYNIPILFNKQGLDKSIAEYFRLDNASSNLSDVYDFVAKHKEISGQEQVKIGIIGKYVDLKDAYKSLNEAIFNSGVRSGVNVRLSWINSENVSVKDLAALDGIVVPGGFGPRGTDGKLLSIKYARENSIPFLGICFGMQLAVIEFARNVVGISDANSSEIDPTTKNPLVSIITEWKKNDGSVAEMRGSVGGTMRLGGYECFLKADSRARAAYGADAIFERHRHRYEINIRYKEVLEKAGMTFSGMSKDGLLTEIVEIKSHPWFIAAQFHPEFNAQPFENSALFASFVRCVCGGARHGN